MGDYASQHFATHTNRKSRDVEPEPEPPEPSKKVLAPTPKERKNHKKEKNVKRENAESIMFTAAVLPVSLTGEL